MTQYSSFTRVARDLFDLFELQMQLLSVDSQVARGKFVRGLACAAAGGVISASALTVAMVALGFLLRDWLAWSGGLAMLTSAAVFFVISGILFATALMAFRAASAAMTETKSEFAENLRWLRATLLQPSTSPRNQFRDETFPRHAADGDGHSAVDSRYPTRNEHFFTR